MDLSPEDRARIYEEEKVRLEAQTTLKDEQRSKSREKLGLGCGVIILLAVAFVAFISMVNQTQSSSTPAAPEPPLSESEKLRRGCQVIKLTYGNKAISDLSLENLKLLRTCETLGY